jgi:hypothetical protein
MTTLGTRNMLILGIGDVQQRTQYAYIEDLDDVQQKSIFNLAPEREDPPTPHGCVSVP